MAEVGGTREWRFPKGWGFSERREPQHTPFCPQRLSKSFQRKSSSFRKPICFRRVFHESHFAFGEGALLTKIIVMFLELFTKTGVLLPTSATLGTWNIRNQKVLYYTYQVPYKMKFESETLHTCTKLSGKPLQYTKKDKFESIIKFLSARWQLDQNIFMT